MDADAGVGNTRGIENMAKEISNNKNTSADANVGVGDTSGTNNMTEKVSNNTNIGAG